VLTLTLLPAGCAEGYGYRARDTSGSGVDTTTSDRSTARTARNTTEPDGTVGRRDTTYSARNADVTGPRTYDSDRPRSSGTSAREGRSAGTNALAFPTGDRRTSAILLEAQAPREVRVGQPYTYTLRVTNLTEAPLHDVRVRDVTSRDDTRAARADDDETDRTTRDRDAEDRREARTAADQAVGPTGDAARDAATAREQARDAAARDPSTPRDETNPGRAPIDRAAPAGDATDRTRTDAQRRDEQRREDLSRAPGGAERDPAPGRGRGARTAAWDVGTLAPGETKTKEFTATADEVGNVANCLTVAYNPTLCLAVTVVKPELKIVKAAPEQALLCQEIVYRYTVTNSGTGTARDVRIEETLPEGLALAQGEARNLSLQVGDLGAGQSREVTARLRATRTGEFAGRATAKAADGLEARSEDRSTRVSEPVLAVDVSAPEARYVGEPVEYTVNVKNTGDANAERVVVRLNAPGAAERLTDRDLGSIEAGKSKSFTINTRAGREAGNLQLTATASAVCAKQASDSASVAIRTAPALQIECIDGTDPIRVGASTTYTITVKNEGTGPDSNVTVRATLPPELEYVGTREKNAADVKAEGRNITFGPVRTLAPGATATWTIEAKALQAGDTRFGLELTSDSLTKPAVETEPTRVVGEERREGEARPAGEVRREGEVRTEREVQRPAADNK
jgi:uncharacterized repeat protein (TIGR01451 family)